MTTTRRAVIAGIASMAALAAFPVRALDGAQAEAFIADVADEVTRIVSSAGPGDTRVSEFLALFRRVAALPQIGRFTLGSTWREMSEAQQQEFLQAFENYAARAYTHRIGEYNGQTLVVTGSQDAGQRGILVNSRLEAPGQQPIRVDWLVSDRGGEVQVVDLIAEGVSLSITQREEFAAMIEARRGDIDRFIADLNG
jgi:phospholipid transport system substrate-binding protein